MLDWLRKLLEADRLAKRVLELEDELAVAQNRLFLEIDGNRRSQVELFNSFLAAVGTNRAVGHNHPLSESITTPPKDAKTPLEAKISESEVDQLAKQYIEQGRENGLTYTPEAEQVLREMIRRNPDQF
jgi:hypothetical protein